MGAKFEYDEVGNTFYYVLVSFYAIILLPATYFLFPSGKVEEAKVDERDCQCDGCVRKRKRKESDKPWKRTKIAIKYLGLLAAWAVFLLIVKKTTEIENSFKEYDPYNILGVDQGASVTEIKKAYRELSKTAHPDRGGDPVAFDRIAKAHQALTDEESRKNWELYGNPDGPAATTFGIALPKWLVSQEYGLWVLAFYGLVFMIILPVGVGMWWRNSIKYNVDQVLMDTSQLFYYYIHKTPKMEVNRMIMILCGSFEFWKQYNSEIIERESDDVELPRLIRLLPHLGENKKERPLCLPYALKARILMHSYLTRVPLESDSLDIDQRYILMKSIRLVEEMIGMAQQINYYTHTKVPVETFENLMKLSPMLVQSLWPKNSALLQLPHISEANLIYCRKNRIFSCADLASMDPVKRRQMLKILSDEQYRDVMVVLSSMPRLSIETHFVVEGEDDAHEVTAGCLVTLKVHLTRTRLIDPQAAGLEDSRVKLGDDQDGSDEEVADPDTDFEKVEEEEEPKPKKSPWAKKPQAKKKKTKGRVVPKKTFPVAPSAAPAETTVATTEETKEATYEPTVDEDKESGDDNDDSDGESSESGSRLPHEDGEDNSDDEEAWDAGKKVTFETKSHETHIVHAPNYPRDKYEWWWSMLTFIDKKTKHRRLAASIMSCKTLTDSQTVEFKFPAPEVKGVYHFGLLVKSDSYIDADFYKDIKLEVKEAKEIVIPKYEDTEDEEEIGEASSDDEYTEDSDDE